MNSSLLFLLLLSLTACGADNTLIANEQLSNALAVSNVVKREVRRTANASQLVGLVIDIDLHNTALIPIERAFTVTWRLLESNGNAFAVDVLRVERMSLGEVRRLIFTLEFPPTSTLSGLRDGLAFDFVDPPPSN